MPTRIKLSWFFYHFFYSISSFHVLWDENWAMLFVFFYKNIFFMFPSLFFLIWSIYYHYLFFYHLIKIKKKTYFTKFGQWLELHNFFKKKNAFALSEYCFWRKKNIMMQRRYIASWFYFKVFFSMNFFLKILAITRNLENEIVLYSQNSVKEKKKEN
jgi:hypothetical protein